MMVYKNQNGCKSTNNPTDRKMSVGLIYYLWKEYPIVRPMFE